ncbi:hypothetical protein ABVK25_012366 [Lepraria finkii]|uniref:Squalene cyclase N-terminal domain-containing protein n=1 Tax=Lepraria finkii TaxID=1340010 RepID=A0ABR4AI91_9LECA
MEVPKEADSSENLHDKSRPGKLLIDLTRDCLVSAVQYSNHTQRDDGHWCGELRANATISAEYVFLYQALELDLTNSRDPLCQWLLSQQQVDGSWSIAPDYPGDVSTTVEVYLALKILNISTNDPAMGRARAFILGAGGVSKIRVFTRVYLALFGLFSWDDVPELPAELIFMPSWSPINIYKFSSWARSTIVPLLILHHHRPVFPLPNGTSASNDYLDELWCGPKKNVPYAKSLYALSQTDGIALLFAVIDKILSYLNGLRSFFPRNRARRLCVEWILEHQDKSGDWAGIFPPMHFGLLALVLEGHKIEDDCVQRGLSAIERFAWQDGGGKKNPILCVPGVGFCADEHWYQ